MKRRELSSVVKARKEEVQEHIKTDEKYQRYMRELVD